MKAKAQEILDQLAQGRYAWVGVKRFRPELFPNDSERLAALEKHHTEETGALIAIIKELAGEIVK
jgi:hypothetical protein